MKKLFILIVLFFIPFVTINAITSTPTTTSTTAKPSLNWHCLQNTRCSDGGANCATGGDVVAGHRIKLKTKSSDLPTKNAATYIFVCLTTKAGNVCTSQNSQLDIKVLGYDGLTKLDQLVSYIPQGVFAPKSNAKLSDSGIASIKSNTTGRLVLNGVSMEGMEMQDYTPVSQARKWLALNLAPPTEYPSGKGGEQQGTFTFEGALAQCVPISWDPYGIVFDSQSLEPVAGVKVTLNKMRTNGQFTIAVGDDIPSILNPVTTVEDGAFEFYVPDGTYKLDVGKFGFTYPSAKSLVANYSKVYSDIYRGENIVQKGAIQHRDVPIDAKGAPYTSMVKVISYTTMLDKGSGTFIVQGRVSHPLTVIKVYGKRPSSSVKNIYVKSRLLTSLKADKLGQFEIKYFLNKLTQNEVIGDIDFIKPDYNNLANTNLDEKLKATLTVEPILNYVEGYAYDDFGKPLANATVGIYLNQGVNPVYETTTDEKGFYKITSEYLPPMSYGLQYTSSTGIKYTVPTTKFISQNLDYLRKASEKVFTYKDAEGNVKTTGKPSSSDNPAVKTNSPSVTTTITNSTPNILIVISLVLITIGIIGIVLAFYLMKRQKQVNI